MKECIAIQPNPIQFHPSSTLGISRSPIPSHHRVRLHSQTISKTPFTRSIARCKNQGRKKTRKEKPAGNANMQPYASQPSNQLHSQPHPRPTPSSTAQHFASQRLLFASRRLRRNSRRIPELLHDALRRQIIHHLGIAANKRPALLLIVIQQIHATVAGRAQPVSGSRSRFATRLVLAGLGLDQIGGILQVAVDAFDGRFDAVFLDKLVSNRHDE